MRYLAPEIERFFADGRKMCFVAGPRQVGKTTFANYLLAQKKKRSAYFNWHIESDRKLILGSHEDFWLRGESSGGKPIRLALDEIHKFPRWKRFLKGLYDAHRGDVEILVAGSGKLDVYQPGGDSLFGRYQMYHLHPFTLVVSRTDCPTYMPWHFLYFFPLPHGHGSLRPTFGELRCIPPKYYFKSHMSRSPRSCRRHPSSKLTHI